MILLTTSSLSSILRRPGHQEDLHSKADIRVRLLAAAPQSWLHLRLVPQLHQGEAGVPWTSRPSSRGVWPL